MLKSGQFLLGGSGEELYKELCMLECLWKFTEVLEFLSISSLTIASCCVNSRKHIVSHPKLSGIEKLI